MSPRHQTHTNLLGKVRHILFGMWSGLRTMQIPQDGINFCQTSSNKYRCKGTSLYNCVPRATTCAKAAIIQWQQYCKFCPIFFCSWRRCAKRFSLAANVVPVISKSGQQQPLCQSACAAKRTSMGPHIRHRRDTIRKGLRGMLVGRKRRVKPPRQTIPERRFPKYMLAAIAYGI